MSCEHNKDKLHDFCKCGTAVPYKHKRCIGCKGETMVLIGEFQEKTGENLNNFADYVLYEAL